MLEPTSTQEVPQKVYDMNSWIQTLETNFSQFKMVETDKDLALCNKN